MRGARGGRISAGEGGAGRHPIGKTQGLDARKHHVLSRKSPSETAGISDAVVIKNGNLFFLCGPDGSVSAVENQGLGLYFNDCRYLDVYEIRVTPERIHPLACSSVHGYKSVFEATNFEFRFGARVRGSRTGSSTA